MKTIKIICLLFVCVAASQAGAQTNSLFEKYADHKSVNSVYISKAMIETNPKIFDNDPVIGKVARNLDVVKIISSNYSSITESFKKDFRSLVKQEKYELLMKQRQQNSLSEFYIVRKGSKIVELVMLVVKNNYNFRYVALIGNLSLKDIQAIVQSEQTVWNGKKLQNIDLKLFDKLERNLAAGSAGKRQVVIVNSDASGVYDEAMKVYDEAMKVYEEGMKQYEEGMKQYEAEMKRYRKQMSRVQSRSDKRR